MNYYNVHLRRTADETSVGFKKLERGMVAKFKYKKGDNTSKTYLALLLHVDWQNKTHALSLNSIEPHRILRIAKDYDEILATSTRVRKLDLPKINMLSKPPKRFYIKELKNDSKLQNGYRTFFVKNISSISVVNYDWGKYDKIPPRSQRKII